MSSTSYLLRLTEAAELLGLTGPRAARRWLEQNKVPMIDYGPGRETQKKGRPMPPLLARAN